MWSISSISADGKRCRDVSVLGCRTRNGGTEAGTSVFSFWFHIFSFTACLPAYLVSFPKRADGSQMDFCVITCPYPSWVPEATEMVRLQVTQTGTRCNQLKLPCFHGLDNIYSHGLLYNPQILQQILCKIVRISWHIARERPFVCVSTMEGSVVFANRTCAQICKLCNPASPNFVWSTFMDVLL